MRERLRPNLPAILLALAGVAVLGWLGLYGFAWTDYDNEAAPAFGALTHGHVHQFLALAPAYGGSLVLRAPFALAPGLWGGGELAVYRMVALPCLLASAAFGVWLLARMRATGQRRLARGAALGLCVASPVTMRALEIGHPEDLLGAVLCVGALLCAMDRRAALTGVLLGLAIATKAWALIALAPVLLALPVRRVRALALAGAVCMAVLAPLVLVHAGGYARAQGLAAQTGRIFQPWQVWWWLGSTGHVVKGADGQVKPGYRSPPAWISRVTHPLIVALAVPLTLLLMRRRARRPWDELLLLVLLFLARCALDPWNNVYYALPFLFALLTWETLGRRRPPLLALASTVALWILFQELPGHVSPDAQAALYQLWALPAMGAIGLRLYAPERYEALAHGRSSYGSRSKASMCRGLTAAKLRRSRVITMPAPARSASATTEASVPPRGELA